MPSVSRGWHWLPLAAAHSLLPEGKRNGALRGRYAALPDWHTVRDRVCLSSITAAGFDRRLAGSKNAPGGATRCQSFARPRSHATGGHCGNRRVKSHAHTPLRGRRSSSQAGPNRSAGPGANARVGHADGTIRPRGLTLNKGGSVVGSFDLYPGGSATPAWQTIAQVDRLCGPPPERRARSSIGLSPSRTNLWIP